MPGERMPSKTLVTTCINQRELEKSCAHQEWKTHLAKSRAVNVLTNRLTTNSQGQFKSPKIDIIVITNVYKCHIDVPRLRHVDETRSTRKA